MWMRTEGKAEPKSNKGKGAESRNMRGCNNKMKTRRQEVIEDSALEQRKARGI